MYNNRLETDPRNILTGKDGYVLSEDGRLIAEAQEFTAKVNFSNADVLFLGDAQTHETLQNFKVSLTMKKLVLRDESYFQELMASLKGGYGVHWTFQGVVRGRDGSRQNIIFRDCVPTGDIDLQNINVSEVFTRTWNFTVNLPPDQISLLTANDNLDSN